MTGVLCDGCGYRQIEDNYIGKKCRVCGESFMRRWEAPYTISDKHHYKVVCPTCTTCNDELHFFRDLEFLRKLDTIRCPKCKTVLNPHLTEIKEAHKYRVTCRWCFRCYTVYSDDDLETFRKREPMKCPDDEYPLNAKIVKVW